MLHTTNAKEEAPATRYLAGSLLQLLLPSDSSPLDEEPRISASDREVALASAASGPGLVA